MPNILHTQLPKGAQLELLNVRVEVARRDEDTDSDFILCFDDWKNDVKVFIPINPEGFRQMVEGFQSNLAGVVVAEKPSLIRV